MVGPGLDNIEWAEYIPFYDLEVTSHGFYLLDGVPKCILGAAKLNLYTQCSTPKFHACAETKYEVCAFTLDNKKTKYLVSFSTVFYTQRFENHLVLFNTILSTN